MHRASAVRVEEGAEQLEAMWSRDPAMKRLFALAAKIAECDAHVLLDGEIGTGRSSFAAAIHARSPGKGGPLRVLACAGATIETLERQLVDAAADAALTLYLDEVTELAPSVQARLVRVLESAGGGSIRVLAATRTSLVDAIARGRFRAELAYWLRLVTLHVPPLRARRGDVALLTHRIVETLSARGGRRVERVAPAALARLERHDWPGNVRELRVAIESAFAIGDGPVLEEGDLPRDLGPRVPESVLPGPSSDEPARIQRALLAVSGDRVRAAAMLGMSRTTLWRRMKALRLLPD